MSNIGARQGNSFRGMAARGRMWPVVAGLLGLFLATFADARPPSAPGPDSAPPVAREAPAPPTVSPRQRLVASQRAEMSKVKAAQAAYRAELARSAPEPDAIADAALAWRHQTRQLVASDVPVAERRISADALYRQIVGALQTTRSQLAAALDANSDGAAATARLRPPPIDPAIPGDLARKEGLVALRETLAAEADRLASARADQVRARRTALHDAMVMLNDARLDTIDYLTPRARRQLLGFGSEGTAQVARELSQISLDIRYKAQSYGQLAVALVGMLLHPTPAFILSLLQILLAVMLFRFWRRNADAFLGRLEAGSAAKRPPTLRSNLQVRLISIVRRVRGPLDWLIFIQIIRWLLPGADALPGIELVWIVLTWLLIAAIVIRLVDEIARGGRRDDPRARLRWKSLRLVGGTIVAVGMTLRITSTSVGDGAIYSWVLSACWMLAPPIILLLAHWWRERIAYLCAESGSDSAILAWNARNPDGIAGLFGRVLAGAILLASGIKKLLVRQAKNIALVREIYGQRTRKRAAEQVAQDRASGMFDHLDEAALAMLQPHRLPPGCGQDRAAPDRLAPQVPPPGAITAIVGDRGLGKSAQLKSLQSKLGDEQAQIHVAVGKGGLSGLIEDIGIALGAEAGREIGADTISDMLRQKSDCIHIAIDDVQRLVIPSIGGLRDFDALIALARAAPPQLRWTFTIGGPAWNYLSRARYDRLVFDSIVRLPRWSAAELRALIEARTREAGLDPDFSELIGDVPFSFDSEVTPEELNRRGYFDLLAEFTEGNPAIALEFWRRSLFRHKATGQTVVRTFATPDARRVAALPQATLFVLRTIVQMDRSEVRHIERSTDLPPIIVADALRGLERIGVIAPFEGGFRVTLFWWAEAIRLLERRNLIVSEIVA